MVAGQKVALGRLPARATITVCVAETTLLCRHSISEAPDESAAGVYSILGTMDDGGKVEEGSHGERILVPHAPGPLIRPDLPRRDRDELDEVIDELFPDSNEPPGWFDAGLLAVAGVLIGWSVASGPSWALVVGLGCLALGVVLPARWLWRRAQRARRTPGVLLPAGDATVARLVRAYDDLGELVSGDGDPARIAAHGALLEVATLLDGRSVDAGIERDYVVARAAAIEDLVDALREQPPVAEPGRLDPTLVALARDELDALTDGGSLTRLTELVAQARRSP